MCTVSPTATTKKKKNQNENIIKEIKVATENIRLMQKEAVWRNGNKEMCEK